MCLHHNIGNMTCLSVLNQERCRALEYLPCSFFSLNCLERLNYCSQLTGLDDNISRLCSLRSVTDPVPLAGILAAQLRAASRIATTLSVLVSTAAVFAGPFRPSYHSAASVLSRRPRSLLPQCAESFATIARLSYMHPGHAEGIAFISESQQSGESKL